MAHVLKLEIVTHFFTETWRITMQFDSRKPKGSFSHCILGTPIFASVELPNKTPHYRMIVRG